jgi:hypothetical protein
MPEADALAPPSDALAMPAPPDLSGIDRNIEDIRGSMGARNKTLQERETALEPVRQSQIREVRQPLPQAPQMQKPPPVPGQPKEQAADEVWLATVGVLGAIAGGLTRNHATNALAAMTGAMNGYQEGRKDKFEENLKQWNAENKRILETNQASLDQYKTTLESRKLALEQKAMELQLTAAKYDDRAVMQAAQQHDFETLGRLLEQRTRLGAESERATAQLTQQHQQWRQSEERLKIDQRRQEETERHNKFMEGQGQEQQMESRARGIAEYNLPPIANPRTPQDRALMGRVMELNPDYRAPRYQGDVSGERSLGGRLANMENIAYKLSSVVPDALAASDAVPRGKWVQLNEAIQAGKRSFSDPALNAFATQNINLAELWARSQKPTGVLDVALQQRALETLTTAKSPQAYRTIVNQIVREIQRELQATKDQRSGKPLEVPQVPGAFVPKGQQPIGGAQGGSMIDTIRGKLPKGWSVEPVEAGP